MTTFDVVLRNALVVDPANGIEAVRDIAIDGARIARVEPGIAAAGRREHNLAGLVAMPGIIDMHVHLSPWLGGAAGHRMLALAGVTTALDMAGPIDGVVDFAARDGAGLSIACIDYIRPGHTVTSPDPAAADLEAALATALGKGAIGLKILGGHFPLTPEAAARAIETAAGHGAYIAFHAGTLASSSSMAGMREACALSAGRPLHLAHINSYARGLHKPALEEGIEAIALLAANPNIWSESYLAPFNGVSGKFAAGAPESLALRRGLERGGFAPSPAGMREAILAGWAMIHALAGGVVSLATGPEGLAAWEAAGSDIGTSFPVNPPEPRIHLATARHADGRFAVDALATDGGGIPRNDIVQRGLALVRLDALDLAGFVQKASVAPARALGLKDKGHLAPGADADITVLDMARLVPVLSYGAGKPVLEDGQAVGQGSRFITGPAGAKAIRAAGMEPIIVAPGTMLPARD